MAETKRLQLQEILDGGDKEKLFEEFLVSTCCNENLLFYRKALIFRKTDAEKRYDIIINNFYMIPPRLIHVPICLN